MPSKYKTKLIAYVNPDLAEAVTRMRELDPRYDNNSAFIEALILRGIVGYRREILQARERLHGATTQTDELRPLQ
jgi:hypothetical protein